MEQFPSEVPGNLVPYEGCPSKLAVHGSYVYAALSSEIVVLDASDYRFTTEVDRWTLGGLVRDMIVTDNCLVVLRAEAPETTAAKLEFYSLADPAHPVFESNIPFTPTSYEFAAAGGILYARNGAEVHLFDISDPSAPAPLGIISQSCNDLSADVGRLFFAVGNVVYMYDTSTPGSPSLSGWWTAPSTVLDLEARGDLAYVVYGGTMEVVDFQQPLIPQVIGDLSCDPWVLFQIMRVGDVVYLRRSLDAYTKDLLAVDVSDPAALVPLWFAPSDLVYSIAAGPNFVAVGERDSDYANPRLTVLSFDPSSVRPSFVEPGPGAPLLGFDKIAVVDDVAWWGANSRLTGVDVSTMPSTSEVGTIDVLGSLQALAGQNGLLYLGLGNVNWGLQVYDVSDPGNPLIVGHVVVSLYPLAMVIGDGVLYVADNNGGLVVFSLADPQQPTFVQRIALPGAICDVALAGNLLCIAAGSEGMLVADCSDPENPVVVGRTLPGMNCYGVATHGSYAYSRSFVLSVVDLAVPTSPAIVAQMSANVGSSITPEGGRILYHDGILYLGAHTDGLQMIDVHDPLQPTSMTDASIASYVKSVSVHRDHVLIVGSPFVEGSTATPYEGLMGFPVQCVAPTGVSDHPVPQHSRRLAAFPNPFNPMTTIRYDLPRDARVSLRVYDLTGRLVRTLVNGEEIAAGSREAVWDGRSDAGRPLAAGTYFCRMEAGSFSGTIRMTLVK